jgi:hypothetical protein
VIPIGSAALLFGYLFLFAAVQGGRFVRNPLLAITEGLSSGGASAAPAGLSDQCAKDLAGYQSGKYSEPNFRRRWSLHHCPGEVPVVNSRVKGGTI